jgi:hypothetical protein
MITFKKLRYNTSQMFALRAPSSEIQHHVVHWKSSDVSEEHVASIFRVEEYAKQESCVKAGGKLVSCLAYYSILKMEATCSSETSVDFQRTTRVYTRR